MTTPNKVRAARYRALHPEIVTARQQARGAANIALREAHRAEWDALYTASLQALVARLE